MIRNLSNSGRPWPYRSIWPVKIINPFKWLPSLWKLRNPNQPKKLIFSSLVRDKPLPFSLLLQVVNYFWFCGPWTPAILLSVEIFQNGRAICLVNWSVAKKESRKFQVFQQLWGEKSMHFGCHWKWLVAFGQVFH